MFFNSLSVMTRSYTDMLRTWEVRAPEQEPEEEIQGFSENDQEIVVRTELPGFEDDEVETQFREGRLIIKGEKHETPSNDDQFHLSYRRVVPLPANIPLDEAKASYREGVLEIHIPKQRPGIEASEMGDAEGTVAELEQLPTPAKPHRVRAVSRRRSAGAKAKEKTSGRRRAKRQTRSRGR
jgi:HSP20 family molecular chaperone IbpA